MTKVSVTLDNLQPLRFRWKKMTLAVIDIADQWRENGRWWKDETACAFYLVETSSGAFLLCQNPKENEWYAKPVC